MGFRSAMMMACFARCYRCGRTSIEDGAHASSKETAANLAADKGWRLAPGLACCPQCVRDKEAV